MPKDNAVLALETGDDFDLTPVERRFAEEYFGGEFAHNGTRSYMAASPEVTYNVASVEASRLLRVPRVRKYLNDLHQRAIEAYTAEYVEWKELVPLAQQILRAHAEGRMRNPLALLAANQILDRAIGKPRQPLETEVGERLDSLIRELSGKRQKNPYVRAEVVTEKVPAQLGSGREGGKENGRGGE